MLCNFTDKISINESVNYLEIHPASKSCGELLMLLCWSCEDFCVMRVGRAVLLAS